MVYLSTDVPISLLYPSDENAVKGNLVKFVHSSPSLNGKYEASPQTSGASVIAAQRTTFPEDHPRISVRTALYYASRYQLGSASLLRWLFFLLGAGGAVWAVGWLPGRWWGTGCMLILLVALLVIFRYWQQRDFVRFVPAPPPIIPAQSLSPQDKAPVMVTGFFSVENKYQRFTWLPGFYRTFATREHALICQITQRPWAGLVRWPDADIGLWYIFFSPSDIRQLQWGELFFGADPRLAIAITHRITIPKQSRFRSEQVHDEIIYLAFETAAIGETIWADLQHEFANGTPSPV